MEPSTVRQRTRPLTVTFESTGDSSINLTNQKEKSKNKMSDMLSDFVSNCSMHGLKNIFEKGRRAPLRLIWLLLLLSGIGGAMYQIVDRLLYYYEWPVTVLLDVNYNNTLLFPTITICNQNKFRSTEAERLGMYRLIEKVYQMDGNNSQALTDVLTRFDAMNITEEEISISTAHTKEDMIMECHWSSEKCGPENFTRIFTNQGICYTFNSDPTKPLHVASSGAENGLRLTLNVEQYEYMPVGHDSVGIKVLLHNPHDVPNVRALGLASPSGTHSFIGLKIVEIQSLPKPRGNCEHKQLEYFTEYSPSACESECVVNTLFDECGCRLSYMPGKGRFQASQLNCDCPVPCEILMFDPTISFTTHSANKISKLLADERTILLEQKLIKAKETMARMNQETMSRMQELIVNMNNSRQLLQNVMIEEIEQAITDYHETLTRIINETETMFNNKMFLFNYQIYLIRKNFERVWEAIAERTFNYVTFNFYNFIFSLQSLMEELAGVSVEPNDTDRRDMLYMIIQSSINGQIHRINLALANFTQYHDSLESGIGIFGYKYQDVPRSHNEYATPKVLLTEQLHTSSERYHELIPISMQQMLECMHNFSNILNATKNTGVFDSSEFQTISSYYFKICKGFNGNISMFSVLTTQYAIRNIRSKIVNIEVPMKTFRLIVEDMTYSLTSLHIFLDNLKLTTLPKVFEVCSEITEYLTNTSITKIYLANLLNSQNHSANIISLQLFMEELRARDSSLYDGWTKLSEVVVHLWNLIIKDKETTQYYEFTNNTELLRPLDNVTKEVIELYVSYRKENNLRNLFGAIDSEFLSWLDAIRIDVVEFRDTNKINKKFVSENLLELGFFYRQLNYEIIIDQVAYGFFSFLCDIGGTMGLLLGASIITLFEVVDLAIGLSFHGILRQVMKGCRKQLPVVDL